MSTYRFLCLATGFASVTAVVACTQAPAAPPAPVTETASASAVAPAPAPATAVDAPAPDGRCRSSQLRLSADGGDAGMGHRVAIIGIQNTGAESCILSGWPTVTLDGANAVRADQATGSYLRSGQEPTPVTVRPQGKAYFDVAWTVVPHEGDGETVCPTATAVRVTVPGDTAALSLAQDFTPCGGRIDVTPFRAEAEPAPPG